MNTISLRSFAAVLLAGAGLSACDSGNNGPAPSPAPPPPPELATFDVTVSNLTNAQPLSPVAVIGHGDTYAVFRVGESATVGLEQLAEGGDNAALIAEADSSNGVVGTASGAAPIPPAAAETVRLQVPEIALSSLRLSVSTMLVNTNDAISGINGANVSDLAVGDARTYRAIVYDAGTEANSELAADIPGPAGGGEGFNPARSDFVDHVGMHAGVVSQEDGFAGSALTGQHRFDNPAVQVRVERID